MTKQHQVVNTTHNKNEPKNQAICSANPYASKKPRYSLRSGINAATIATIIGRQRMTQRIKLNIVEKIPPLKKKANPWKGIQLMHESQSTPLILLLPLTQIPPNPFFSEVISGLVISDYSIIF
ncbi:hypothetical protein BD0027_00730 [Helicobacter pylori]